MEDVYGKGETLCDLDKTKDRAIREYVETPSNYSILVQFEARSRERLAILSNAVTCSRPLQDTTCRFHRKKRYA